MTSTTIPTLATPSSAGVKTACTCTPDTLVRRVLRAPLLLPPSRPRDRPLVLGMRTADLLRVHDPCAGRHSLPRALGQGAGRPARHAGCEPCEQLRIAARERGDDVPDRIERPRLPRRARAW